MAVKQLNVGDVEIEELVINAGSGTYDLVPHLEEINIYENIFSNHLTGHLTLVDTFNIPYKAPIIGEETIGCRIRMVGDTGEHILDPPFMHIHDLRDRFQQTNARQRFSLQLVSEQCMSNLHCRVSKSFKDWSISDIVEDIHNVYLDDDRNGISVEETHGIETCIIPNWDPHTAFNWLASRARPASAPNAVNYLFFETMDGTFFKSLQTLATQTAAVTFVLQQRVDDAHKIEALANSRVVKVDHILYMNQFEKIDNIMSGMYSSKLVTHDITKKKIAQFDYNGFDDWPAYTHVSPHPPINNSPTEVQAGNTQRNSLAPSVFPEVPIIDEGRRPGDFTDSVVKFFPKHDQMYGATSGEKYDNDVVEWRLQRNAHISYYNGIRMQVQCGGLDFVRVGMIVGLIVPRVEGNLRSTDESYDKFLTGRYMVSAIRHIITQSDGTNYKMMIELIKDGLGDRPGYRAPTKTGVA